MADLSKYTEGLSDKKRRLLELMLAEKRRKGESPAGAATEPAEKAEKGISHRAVVSPVPVSFAQQRLWFIDQLDPGTPAFNIPAAVRIRGTLDLAMMRRGFGEIVRRHESLRTRFGSDGGRPVQIIDSEAVIDPPVVDLSPLPEAARMPIVQRFITAECQRSFDLERCPLVRVHLLRLGEADHVLVLMMHHIIGDVWSVRVLMRELATLCGAFAAGRPSPLPELPIQYGDYAIWQREWMRGPALEESLDYWKGQLTGMPGELELPADHPRPPVQSVWGAKRFLHIPRELADRVRALGREESASSFMTLLAAWKALLHRYTGQDDVVVGAPVANRNRSELEPLIGFFVNSLVLRTDLSGDPSFRDLLRRQREVVFGAFSHQDFPFERLVEVLQPERNMSRNPLFQTDFILQNSPRSAYEVPGLSFEPLPVENGTAQLDMTLDLWEEADGLGGWLEYDVDLFDGSTVARVVRHYENVLAAVTANPDAPLSELPYLSGEERHQLLAEWNDTGRAYDLEAVFPSLFAAQARRAPEAVAAVCGEEQRTYGELSRHARGLAALLAAKEGVGTDPVIGLLARRGIGLMTAMLGVLEAGGAYLPMDPGYPAGRHRQVLEESRVRLVLAARDLLPVLEEAAAGLPAAARPRLLVLEEILERARRFEGSEPPAPRAAPESLAYVITTSGSTGTPKGVMIHHRGLLNHLWANIEILGMTGADIMAQTASQCFDISVWQFFAPLILGGSVHIFPDEVTQDPPRLFLEVDRAGITIFETVPSLLRLMLSEVVEGRPDPPRLSALRWLLPTGEALPPELSRDWFRSYPRIPLMNAYGPSECSDDVTLEPLFEPLSRERYRAPIGRPVGNLRTHLVDRVLRPVAAGVAGELCVGGVGVGRGYLQRPERTAASFVPDPFAAEPGARLYRSGDLARHLADGRLEFLGRVDFQVKVRGFRIELGEIEAVLALHPAIREAVVLAREDTPGDRRLVAYLVVRETEPSAAELREHLKGRLPEHMVPSAFVLLPDMPRNRSGKVDRKALPAPERCAGGEDRPAFVAPRTPTEEVLAGIWAEILDRDPHGGIGVEDNLFELGAHSLLVTQVASRLRGAFAVEFPLRSFFESPTVAGMAHTVDRLRAQAEGVDAPPIVRIPRDGHLPLSFTQERMWFLDQLEPGLTAYNVPGAVYMDGTLHVAALTTAFTEILRRHEVFRTTYAEAEGRPVPVFHPPSAMALPLVDLQALPEERREPLALALAKEDARRPFDLAHGPVLRPTLVRMAPDRHLLAMTTHHIAYDMWAREIFIFELGVLYTAFAAGRPSPLPEPEIQYVDYAAWQRRWLQGEVLEAQLGYWRGKLAGSPASLDLPADFPRPPVQSYRGARQYLQLPPELARGIDALARRTGVTRFIVVLASFQALLARYTGQERITVGSPIANRNRMEVEKIIGFLANTIVLSTDLAGDPPFRELIDRARETALGAYAHQDVPFELLVQDLHPERDMSRSPLFQVMFNYMLSYSAPSVELPDLKLRLERLHSGAAQFDVNVDLWETPEGLAGVIEYCVDLFRHATITRFVQHFRALLESAVASPEARLSDLGWLTAPEQAQVLREWNDTARAYGGPATLHGLFEAQVARTPDAPAVTFEGESLTYGELDRRAGGLARRLAELGVGPESRVGVCLERSLDLMVALLAVLKAGGAYLPLDPEHPAERLGLVLADAGAAAVLVQQGLAGRLPEGGAPVLTLPTALPESSPRPAAVDPDGAAYVIYTSGSTGRPKGVVNTHRGIVNRLLWMQEAYGLTAADVVLQKTPYGFDVSVWELFWPLAVGARLEIAIPGGHRDGRYLVRRLAEGGVTTVHFVPSLLEVFLEEDGIDACRGLRRVIASGEALPPELERRFFERLPGVELHNLYGPTEAAVDVTAWACRPEPGRSTVPIGRPIANLRIHLLDRGLAPVPIQVPGELHIGGVGLARGYLGRPDLTAERFVPDPTGAEPGGRLYKTGDFARLRTDGAVEFLGRLDFQVKIRGFRIELGEIEAVLAGCPGVQQAVVLAREDTPGDRRLVAYVAGEPEREDELRERARAALPAYMVPAAFVFLEALPLNANGKLDRKALPAPDGARPGSEESYVAPRDAEEERIAAIFREVLGVERVSVLDSFFDAGGHSLMAMQVLSRVRRDLGVDAPLRLLFERPSVAGMAEAVRAIRWAAAPVAEEEMAELEEEELVL